MKKPDFTKRNSKKSNPYGGSRSLGALEVRAKSQGMGSLEDQRGGKKYNLTVPKQVKENDEQQPPLEVGKNIVPNKSLKRAAQTKSNVREIAEEFISPSEIVEVRKKVMAKVQNMKTTMTGSPPDPVEINPVKPGLNTLGYN